MLPKRYSAQRCLVLALLLFAVALPATLAQQQPGAIQPPPPTVQFPKPRVKETVVEASQFIRVVDARRDFKVSGKGLTAAVLDTGLRTTHVDFKDRVVAQKNFTKEGKPDDAADLDGHGTNVGGIIVANGDHIGMAPEAGIIPLKVFSKNGGSFNDIDKALQWVIDHRKQHSISVVNMSLGDAGNFTKDDGFAMHSIRLKIQQLRKDGVAVVVAAGNDYFKHDSQQGMSFPGIVRETISVGAVYDSDIGPFDYLSGAIARTTGPGRITPFSQRLHEKVNPLTRTDIFSPGAPLTSSGIQNDHGESIQHGTSQAAPVAAGVILLMQEHYKRVTDELPSVDDLETWLRRGGVTITDGDDEDGNVTPTNEKFVRLDALGALQAVQRDLQIRLLKNEKLKK